MRKSKIHLSNKETDSTINDFGLQWVRYRENEGYYASVELLADIVGPLVPLNELQGARIAEIGSGTGRIVNMLLSVGASEVIALEPSAAYDVLRENTADHADRVTYIHGSGETLPAGLNLDFVMSIGVVHHIPDPDPVLRAAKEALKPGGKCLVWLYGKEGNESYLRVVLPLRRLTSRLPDFLLVAISHTFNWILTPYIWLCQFIRLPMRGYMLNVLAKFNKKSRLMVVFDQLNPAYAKYYTEKDATSLLERVGFDDVQIFHRHGYSWTVIGTNSAKLNSPC